VGEDQQIRAQPHGAGHRHGRAHAEVARLVGAGGDHAALLRAPANGDGPAAQRGIAPGFDGAEESVEVEVKDLTCHINKLACFPGELQAVRYPGYALLLHEFG